ncbi:MAG: hypothetical protein ACRCXZ_03875 [Patescibacteria group bacterium]
MTEENCLNILSSTNNDLEHYKAFLHLGYQNEIINVDNFKKQDYQLPNCTAKVWIFDYKGKKNAYSESRFINSLIYLLIKSGRGFNDIDELLEFYNCKKYFSSIRETNLVTLFQILCAD